MRARILVSQRSSYSMASLEMLELNKWLVVRWNVVCLESICVCLANINCYFTCYSRFSLDLLQVCTSDGYYGCTDGLVEVLNASRNAVTSVSEISSLVELRALILNSEFPYSMVYADTVCQARA